MAVRGLLAAPGPHFAVATLFLLVAVLARSPVLALAIFPLGSAAVVYALARVVADRRWLTGVALANLSIGLTVSLGLYWLSGVKLPALDGLVLEKGFWTFGGDAIYYHMRGIQIAYSLSHRVLLPQIDPTYGANYIDFVGVLYSALGPHPLLMPFVNCLLAAVSVVLVYAVVARVAGGAAARRAALLAAVVPSVFLWSGQLLKDTPSLFLFLLALATGLHFLDMPPTRPYWRAGALLLLLSVTVFALYSLRFYMASGLLIVFVAAPVLLALARRRRLRVLDAVVMVVVFVSIVLARAAGVHFLLVLVNPVGSPAAQAYLAAVELEHRGNLVESRDQYVAAIRHEPGFWPAYRRLGEVLICLGDLRGAEPALARYLGLYPMDYSEPAIRRTIARLTELRTGGGRISPTVVRTGAISAEARQACGGLLVKPPTVVPGPVDKAPTGSAREAAPAAVAADLRAELIWTLHSPDRMYGDRGEFMARPLKPQQPRVGELIPQGLYYVSPAFAAAVRNGFVRTGGDSLYTRDLAVVDNNPLQWLKWAPSAFFTTLGAPFPWAWHKEGRLDPLRVAMGLESIGLLVLLPFGVLGAWRATRSGTVSGVAVVILFALLGTVLGMVIVNVGTLVRLRLPVTFLLVMLAALGGSRPKPE
jgi:hypothetical protein